MARLRSRYLTCFYCGKRSDTRFDGVTRQFTCKYCDAANHLDEKGEITDPPVATEHVAATPIAASFSSQPQPGPDAAHPSIFCATCLKNQRLFVASLAQYLPGDGDDDVKLDRDYYRFRRGLEKRYPQVCATCEAAAADAIQRAEYTAKTDHLRKMMEMSRRHVRRVYRRRTPLDWLHVVVRAVWWAGLALQMIWHLKLVAGLLGQSDSGMSDPDDASIWSSAVEWLRWAVTFLAEDDRLIRASITTSFASVWWNPKFVQVSRGFTKQLSGFRQWYLFQVLICVSRYFLRGLDLSAQPRSAQLSAHLAMVVMTVFVHAISSGCIKTDTTPLFAPHNGTISPKQNKPVHKKRDEIKTLAETLDDVLPQPGESPARAITSVDSVYEYQFIPKAQATPRHNTIDEMEWTPTAPSSLPRALKDSPSSKDRPFGQAPTREDAGPFFYKTPPAPINPARKLRNPPNQPALWSSTEKENSGPFKGIGAQQTRQNQNQKQKQNGGPTARSGVEFKSQTFFTTRKEGPEDESLIQSFGQTSLSLDDKKPTPPGKQGWLKQLGVGGRR